MIEYFLLWRVLNVNFHFFVVDTLIINHEIVFS